MNDNLIKNYELSVAKNEELFEWMLSNYPDLKPSKMYIQSYESYFGHSNLNQLEIMLKIKGYKNASVSIHSYIIEKAENPFVIHLWKYNGTHYFKDIDLNTLDLDYKQLSKWIIDFFYKTQEPAKETKRYEQLLLF